MRFICEVSQNVSGWNLGDDANSLAERFRGGANEMFLVRDGGQFSFSGMSESVKSVIADFLFGQGLPVTYQPIVSNSIVDFATVDGAQSIDEFYGSITQQQRNHRIQGESRIGETGGEFLGRTLGPFLPYATEVHIFDPYFLKHLFDHGANGVFVKRLLKKSSADLVVHTTTKELNLTFTGSALQAAIRDKFTEVLRADSARSRRVSVSVYPEDFHNRRMQFVFSRGSMAFALDNGVQTFENKGFPGKLGEPMKVSSSTPEHVSELRTHFDSQSRRGTTHQWMAGVALQTNSNVT